MNQRALVTGANGFVGRILCAHLEQRGWRVLRAVFDSPHALETERVCDLSLRREADALAAWAEPVDCVFHLGALTFVPLAAREPALTMTVNLCGTINLLEALRANGFGGRFVFVGSAGAYGQPRTLPVTEEHPLCPLNPYDISKAAADQYCAFASEATGMDIVRTRPFNHSGPGQKADFAMPAFARQIARIERGLAPPVLQVGDLSKARDFLHVDDVVAAYEAVALRGRPGEAYNVCSGKSTTIRTILDVMLPLARAPIEVITDPALLRPADAPDVAGSHDKITAHTGWKPALPLERIVQDTLDDWRGRVGQGEA